MKHLHAPMACFSKSKFIIVKILDLKTHNTTIKSVFFIHVEISHEKNAF